MRQFLKQNMVYLVLYVFILITVGVLLLNGTKVQIHREMNAVVGNPFFDLFFSLITHLGDGAFAFLIAIIFLYSNVRKSIYIILSYIGAAAISSILKHIIFPHISRPHFVFQYYVREKLNLVSGIEILGFNSFPSGHALSAFALFFV